MLIPLSLRYLARLHTFKLFYFPSSLFPSHPSPYLLYPLSSVLFSLPSLPFPLPLSSCDAPILSYSFPHHQPDDHGSKSVRGGSSPSMSLGVRNERNVTGTSGGFKGSIARRYIKSLSVLSDFYFSSFSSFSSYSMFSIVTQE